MASATMSLPSTSGQMKDSILSLPTELILTVLSMCTDSSLLGLAQTCRDLNVMALQTFFDQRNILGLEQHIPFFSWTQPRVTLDAVRMALFIKDLRGLTWYSSPGFGDVDDEQEHALKLTEQEPESVSSYFKNRWGRMGPLQRVIEDMDNLRMIIARNKGIKKVNFLFMLCDSWLEVNRQWITGSVDTSVWRRSFRSLLDVLLDSDCEEICIYGGGTVNDLVSFNQETGRDSELTSSKDYKSANTKTRSIHNGRGQLKQLHIDSDMLLTPPFLEWTMSLLCHSRSPPSTQATARDSSNTAINSLSVSETLTHLSLNPGTVSVPVALLNALDLPKLVEFKITSGPKIPVSEAPMSKSQAGRAKFEDVTAFLSRHEGSLEKLVLYGSILLRRPSFQKKSAKEAKPLFRKLTSVVGHPSWVIWLLDLAATQSTSGTLHFGMKHSCGRSLANLNSIDITSEYYAKGPAFDYGLFDKAFRGIFRLCRWRDTQTELVSRNAQSNSIELTLRFASERGLGAWFASHLSNTSGSSSSSSLFLRELKRVSMLTISGGFNVNLSSETVDILPAWLALIGSGISARSKKRRRRKGLSNPPTSSLQEISIVNLGSDMISHADFALSLADTQGLGNLKWLEIASQFSMVDRSRFDLDELRSQKKRKSSSSSILER